MRATSPAIGITNQRETTVVWDRRDRTAGPPRHRVAGSAHRGRLRGAARRRAPRTLIRAQGRPGARSVLLGHQGALAARARARAARARRAWRARLRHHRLLAGVEADRRRRPRHRSHQRLAHAALRHPRAALGRRAAAGCSRCPRAMLPEVRPSSGVVRARPTADVLGAPVPIAGIAGDQQAALFGQGCIGPAWRRTPTAPAASC